MTQQKQTAAATPAGTDATPTPGASPAQEAAPAQGAAPAQETGAPAGRQDPNADVASMPYEQARDELVDVVRRLEAGSTSLEDALTLWERGEVLAQRCQSWLDGARERLDAARVGAESPEKETA